MAKNPVTMEISEVHFCYFHYLLVTLRKGLASLWVWELSSCWLICWSSRGLGAGCTRMPGWLGRRADGRRAALAVPLPLAAAAHFFSSIRGYINC